MADINETNESKLKIVTEADTSGIKKAEKSIGSLNELIEVLTDKLRQLGYEIDDGTFTSAFNKSFGRNVSQIASHFTEFSENLEKAATASDRATKPLEALSRAFDDTFNQKMPNTSAKKFAVDIKDTAKETREAAKEEKSAAQELREAAEEEAEAKAILGNAVNGRGGRGRNTRNGGGGHSAKFLIDNNDDVKKAIAQLEAQQESARAQLVDLDDKNWDALSEAGRDKAMLRIEGFAEELFDTSAAQQVLTGIDNYFNQITGEVGLNVDHFREQLSTMIQQIPASIVHTDSGNVFNAASQGAIDLTNQIQTLLSNLGALPKELSKSDDVLTATKNLKKYTEEWEKARDKRDDFVINTNSNAFKQYDAYQKEIESLTTLRDKAQAVVDVMKRNGANQEDSEFREYVRLVEKYDSAIQNATKSQQALLKKRGVAEYKATYDTYTEKMLNANIKSANEVQSILDKQTSDLSNATTIAERFDSLVSQIVGLMGQLQEKTEEAVIEQELLTAGAKNYVAEIRNAKPPEGFVKTDDYKEQERLLKASAASYASALKQQKKLRDNGTDVGSKSWKNNLNDLTMYADAQADAYARLKEMQADGRAFEPIRKGPSGAEVMATDAGKRAEDAFNAAVDKSKRGVDSLIERNMSAMSDVGREAAQAFDEGFGEKLYDTSGIDKITSDIDNAMSSVKENMNASNAELKSSLDKALGALPKSLLNVNGGQILNELAMDAKAAYVPLRDVMTELEAIPKKLAYSKELQTSLKDVQKLKDAYAKESKARDDFVANTHSRALKEYDDLEKKIAEQVSIRDQAQNAINEMTSRGVSEKDPKLREWVKQLNAANNAIKTLTNSQQTLIRSRGVADNKATYESHTRKMVEINQKLQEKEAEVKNLQDNGATNNIESLKARYVELRASFIEAYTALEQKIHDATNAEAELIKNAEYLIALQKGLKPADKDYKMSETLKNNTSAYNKSVNSLKSGAKALDDVIQTGKSADSDAFKKTVERIEKSKNDSAEFKQNIEEAVESGNAFEPIKPPDWGGALWKGVSAGGKAFWKTAKKEFSAIGKLVGKISSGIKGWFKNQKSLSDSAKEMWKTFSGYLRMLRTRIRRKFISMIFEDLQENIKRLAQMSPRLNKAISGFIVSAKTLGAQIVAAFEPLVAQVLPYVSQFVDYLTYAASQMAQFISNLFGDDTYIKAIKGQYDFAASVDNTTSSTKKATKAAKEYENTVLSFDELHKLNGTDSSADEEDALGMDATELKNMENNADAFNRIAKKIHDALAMHDYKGAGKAMAEGVNEAFSWLKDKFGWKKNFLDIIHFIQHVIDGVNGFLDEIDGSLIGEAIGDIINTAVNALYMLTDPKRGIHFDVLGQRLGEAFVAMFKTIDWKRAGIAIMNGLQGMLRGITAFLKANGGVGASLGDAFAKFFGGAIEAMNPSDWGDFIATLINNLFAFFEHAFADKEKARELGSKIGEALNRAFEGIDWDTVMGGINNMLTAFNEAVGGFSKSFHSTNFFKALWKFVTGLNWGQLFEFIGRSLGTWLMPAVISGLGSALTTFAKTIGIVKLGKWILKKIGFGNASETALETAGDVASKAAGGSSLAKIGWSLLYNLIHYGKWLVLAWDAVFIGKSLTSLIELATNPTGYAEKKVAMKEKADKEGKVYTGGIVPSAAPGMGGINMWNVFYSLANKNKSGTLAEAEQKGLTRDASLGRRSDTATIGLTDMVVGTAMNSAMTALAPKLEEIKTGLSNFEDAPLFRDGDVTFDDFYARYDEDMMSREGKLPTAGTEDFQKAIAGEVGAAFLDALSKSAGDIVLMVSGNELGRISMNYASKYTKQYLATKPAVT